MGREIPEDPANETHAGDGADARDGADWRGLARAWPRSLIAAGQGSLLARWWRVQEREAAARDEPPLARVVASRELLEQLAAARRARRLKRGLEGVAAVLASEEAGLRAAAAIRSGDTEGVRISRLLVVSADGSARFYRQVTALRRQYASRLEALMLDCDEARLGEAIYGQGRRARAVLLDHKDAVARLLSAIESRLASSWGGHGEDGDDRDDGEDGSVITAGLPGSG